MDIYLSDRAFVGLIVSAIEVYKKECLGSLLGYHTPNRIMIEHVLPYQTAKRKPTEVEPNWKRESRVREIIPKLLPLQQIGYFHSHTQHGDEKAVAGLSRIDKVSMNPKDTEVIVAVNEGKRRVRWHRSNQELRGSVSRYHVAMAGYYKRRRDGKIKKYHLISPYALGFGEWPTTC